MDQTTITGNVGRAPEMRYTPTGVPVTTFSVAVNHVYTDAQGQRQERTKWYRITTWRKLAEVCAQYVRTGMKVLVTGEVAVSAWLDKEGAARGSLELTAESVEFLSGREEAGEPAAAASAAGAPTADAAPGEIPF